MQSSINQQLATESALDLDRNSGPSFSSLVKSVPAFSVPASVLEPVSDFTDDNTSPPVFNPPEADPPVYTHLEGPPPSRQTLAAKILRFFGGLSVLLPCSSYIL